MSSNEIKLDDQLKLDESRRTRVLLERQLSERTDYLITQLVSDYRSNKLQHDKMVGSIAEIAGMMEQIDKLTRTIRGA